MQNKKWILGIIGVAVVAVAIVFGSTQNQKGSFVRLTRRAPVQYQPLILEPKPWMQWMQPKPVSKSITKLNFAWFAPVSATLTTGNQIEVGRFTLGADPDINNPAALVSVTALNFIEIPTATLTNFTLNDITNNVNVAINANSSTFNFSASGGFMSALNFQQGEIRTFKILADVGTNAGYQTVQFRFASQGSAIWNVTNNGLKGSDQTVTVLANNVPNVWSTTLTAAANGSDTTAPTIALSYSNGTNDNSIIDEIITATFSEKIDPASINNVLVYGGSISGVPAAGGCGLVSPSPGNPNLTLTNIASLTGNFLSDINAFNGRTTCSLNAAGLILVINPTGYTRWNTVAANGDVGLQTVDAGLTTTIDTAGNLLKTAGSTTESVDF